MSAPDPDSSREVVVITGGSKGLGRGLVERFLEEGYNVATCARDATPLNALRDEHKEDLLIQSLDVSDTQAVIDFSEAVLRRWKRCDILINNASILGPRKMLDEYPPAEWKEVLDANATGCFNFIHAFLPYFRKVRSGVVLNITSGASIVGKARWGAYAASKFAVEGLTQVLREEAEGDHIRVHSIDPGAMRTSMRAAAYPDEDPMTLPTREQIAKIIFDLAVIYEPTMTRLKARDYL